MRLKAIHQLLGIEGKAASETAVRVTKEAAGVGEGDGNLMPNQIRWQHSSEEGSSIGEKVGTSDRIDRIGDRGLVAL